MYSVLRIPQNKPRQSQLCKQVGCKRRAVASVKRCGDVKYCSEYTEPFDRYVFVNMADDRNTASNINVDKSITVVSTNETSSAVQWKPCKAPSETVTRLVVEERRSTIPKRRSHMLLH